ncbi:30S ribosomal protein S8 [Candidatus Woesearchaeota archaeon]|jgi:small subunit ribosomal protein S8|nr:30S ribosomal protein S8 [Candidatus Woesearchaeota archaeon]MBT5397326.1 30S ribosomal protein S8 [Candidatus Woesearchaeota archaeon]MBT5924807.1 30S ribosomal protein S8 [Candidatus Woesearchaeota archaeon]MBT6367829.1 30S ribosomal protein S8 [Candidatus Woesearchaeota archaeon]MBT7762726.1 30S ribosomal protein S8 [Candidatus Woesearchaeota archaeon]
MLNDPLAAALTKIINAERVGKREVVIRPTSKMIKAVLRIMNENNYLGTFEELPEGLNGVLKVNLLGNINKCGVIKPRFSVKKSEFEKWEKRYLPAKDFGLILISTPNGIMTHTEAKDKNTGGKLLVYCY